MSEHLGWLLVSGDCRNFKEAKDKKYLVLRPSERAISVYKKQEDVAKAPSAVLDVTSYIIEKEYVPGFDHAFRLTTQKGPTLLAAESAKGLDGWFAAITAVGMRVASEPADLARRKARTIKEEEMKVELQKEKDESEFEKQKMSHRKQTHLLKRKQVREKSELKRKSIKDELEQEWRHDAEVKKQVVDLKEEAEDLTDKIQEKNSPSDPDELKRKKQVKQLTRRQEREVFSMQQEQSKKDMKLSLKQQDDLQKTVASQQEEEVLILEKHEVELHAAAQRRHKELFKLNQKCHEEMEKQQDAIQWRREKAKLVKAAAMVIATQGAPSKAPPKPEPEPEPEPELPPREEEEDKADDDEPAAEPELPARDEEPAEDNDDDDDSGSDD